MSEIDYSARRMARRVTPDFFVDHSRRREPSIGLAFAGCVVAAAVGYVLLVLAMCV